MRLVVRHLWRGYSPGGALEAQQQGTGTDLRALLASRESWFVSLMRACTPVLGQECAGQGEVLPEHALDVLKVS